MSNMEFFEQTIKCPHCEENISINFVYEDDGLEAEICGGHTICELCGSRITDEDLESFEKYESKKAKRK